MEIVKRKHRLRLKSAFVHLDILPDTRKFYTGMAIATVIYVWVNRT